MATFAETRGAFSVRFVGLAETAERFRALADSPDAIRQLAGALYRRSSAILAVSQRLVPVDTGALRGTGHVTAPKVDSKSATVEVVYGGPAAPYARIVHEDLNAHHTVGQAKYLETAATAEREGTLKALHDAVKAYLASKKSRRLAA